MQGIYLYFNALQALQKKVVETQKEVLAKVAEIMAQTIARDQRIFLFGTGHSHLLIEEAFYRAGGLAAVVPIFSSALMLHEHASLGSKIERTAGIARFLLEEYRPMSGEILLVFSNSGVNRMPVEMAIAGHDCGLFVVGICSKAYSRLAPLSDLGKRLDEVCDYCFDNGGLPGDAIVEVEGVPWRTGPTSTAIGVLIWNCLLVETVFQLKSMGVEPPIFVSSNMPSAEENNRQLFEKWRKVNPHL